MSTFLGVIGGLLWLGSIAGCMASGNQIGAIEGWLAFISGSILLSASGIMNAIANKQFVVWRSSEDE